ncbi:hypothetical protein L13192_12233, partial [Pyrenophora tritici-repentis]
MRLLHTTGDGRLGWTEDLIGDKIPPYAILSHTWKEGQEVTFANLKDLDNAVDVDTQRKEGYRKIRFCAQQAKRDGLDYFWVDTCCIDKANNTELSKAINSIEGKENALERLRSAAILKHKGRSQDQEEKLSKIRNWLSASDPSTNYHKAHKQRQAETGVWLLEGEQFTTWKESAASRLWLYGIPGCGKTILSSTIIKHLLQHCHDDTSIVTAYFYFDFNDTQKQDPELMLHSLLYQLVQRSVVIPKGVDALFLSCEDGKRQPSLHALLQVIRETAQEFTHVYVVLDALDECTQRSELMDMLKTVVGWQLDNLHLLMTSRKEWDIETSLESYVGEEDAVCLQRDVVDQDIQRYVQQRLCIDKGLAKWNKDAAIRQEIETAMIRGAHGMFRWVVCQLDTLAKCLNRAMLRESLTTLPQTLDQTYERILSAINDGYSKYAMRILQWLTFSARPLSVEEIAEVVAIDVARDLAFDRDEVLEDPLEALSICSSLVTITKNEADGRLRPAQQIIALAHYSVQEYLVSDRIKQGSAKQYSMQEAECHDVITRGSLKYLIQLQRPLSEETFEECTLARYTAEFWSSHLRNTGDETEGSLLAISLMSTEKPAFLTWIRLYDPDDPWEDSDLERSLERTLLDKGINVNAQGRGYGNALQAASAQGHEQVVKALLDAGAEVNAQGGYYGNALHAAAYFGESAVLKLLVLKHDITQLQDPYDRTLLWWAAASGHSKTVQVLVNQYNYDPQINILYKDRQANISLNIKKFHQKLGQSIKRNRFQLSLSRAATRLKRYS